MSDNKEPKDEPLKLSDPITIVNQGPAHTCKDCGSHNIETNWHFPTIVTSPFEPIIYCTGVDDGVVTWDHLRHIGT
jgi:hypothetical protein